MSAAPVELAAYRRAVEGVEQPFACGGEVHVRRHYSDGLLRLLLQGSNPRKYGPNLGSRRKRLLKHERRQMEREIRAEMSISLRPRSLDEVKRSILVKLDAIQRHRQTEKSPAGWTRSADARWVPPGDAWVGMPECDPARGWAASYRATMPPAVPCDFHDFRDFHGPKGAKPAPDWIRSDFRAGSRLSASARPPSAPSRSPPGRRAPAPAAAARGRGRRRAAARGARLRLLRRLRRDPEKGRDPVGRAQPDVEHMRPGRAGFALAGAGIERDAMGHAGDLILLDRGVPSAPSQARRG